MSIEELVFVSPLEVRLSINKKFMLNLNKYRNTHFYALSKAKKNYKAVMSEQIIKSRKYEKCTIEYKLFPKTKSLCDISNVLSVVDKFFCDALVDFGVIPDDNYTIVRGVSYLIGKVDKRNPRVEIKITEID